MNQQEAHPDDFGDDVDAISRRTLTVPIRALVSKRAQRAYAGTLLAIGTALSLLVVAAVAYWLLYFHYIPQIGVERVVHLQFGDDAHPWGVTALGSDLAPLQPYDVSVSLHLPRTPSNLAAGNFMLDLALLAPSQKSPSGDSSNASVSVIAQSRRPAILTYASPLVDTTQRLFRMPLYLAGWQREAETLEVGMMEDVEFARGWRNLPASARLEIQSREVMQVYKAVVKFKARFSGLRWFMYNWRLTSFAIFTLMFWSVSMLSAGTAWVLLPSFLRRPSEDSDSSNVKEESESSDSSSSGGSSNGDKPIKHEEDTIKEEDFKDTGTHTPLPPENEDDGEDIDPVPKVGDTSDSGLGTSMESPSARGLQRRRSRLYNEDDGHDL